MKAVLDGEVVKRRHQHGGLDRATFQRGIAARAAADLQKGHVLFGIHAELAQDHDRFAMRRAAEAADTERLAFEIFHSFHVRAGDQIMIRAVHGRHDDAHRQAGECCADEVGECAAIIDVAGDDAVDDDLILHDDDNAVEPFGFEEAFFFGDHQGHRSTAGAGREAESDAFLSGQRLDG